MTETRALIWSCKVRSHLGLLINQQDETCGPLEGSGDKRRRSPQLRRGKQMLKTECTHYDVKASTAVEPKAQKCQVCGLNGPLRMCGTCGFVGCCESMNSHDTDHWKESGHPII